ncbi:LAETG motif-containing sortase-dependent surface protein [Streptomyces sp. NPDC055243]|uniref:LAETG motif-containing sortase-dependent surface protein n=1 Tax=Streptomyces sp. NPDC055243 TaxID=3365720 RepID=UPI0037CDFD00
MATATLAAGALGAATAPAAAADVVARRATAANGEGSQDGDSRPRRVQARTVPRQEQREPVGQQGTRGELADTGSDSDTMLYAGLAIALCTLGALAVAAARSRRDYRRDR